MVQRGNKLAGRTTDISPKERGELIIAVFGINSALDQGGDSLMFLLISHADRAARCREFATNEILGRNKTRPDKL